MKEKDLGGFAAGSAQMIGGPMQMSVGVRMGMEVVPSAQGSLLAECCGFKLRRIETRATDD